LAPRCRPRTVVYAVKRRTAWSVIAALLLAQEASAQPSAVTDPEVVYPSPFVRVFADLTFVLDPKAVASCIFDGGTTKITTEEVFRLMVAARVGAVFKPDPRAVRVGRIRVEVSRIPGGLTGSYAWEHTDGTLESWHTVERGVTPLHCKEVLEGLAVGLAVYFDWIAHDLGEKYARRSTPPASSPPALPCPACAPPSRFDLWPREWPLPPLEKPKPDPPAKPERAPFAVRVGVSVWPELVAAGWGSFGLSAEAGVRYGPVSLGVEAHGDPPLGATTFPGVGAVSFARLSGALLLCGSWGWFAGCGVGDVGRVLFPDHVHALPASVFYGAVGARAGLEFPVAPPRFFLRAALDLRAPIHPASYKPDGVSIFEATGLGVGLGLGFLVELPP
jgi:hypothetical protein